MSPTEVSIANSKNEVIDRCRIDWRRSGSEWSVELSSSAGNVANGTGTDLFSALQQARREFDRNGLKLCCNGARRDVYPSRMGREMSGGTRAYVLRKGKQGAREDLVSLLEPAEPSSIATVDEQDAYYREWLGSLGRDRPN